MTADRAPGNIEPGAWIRERQRKLRLLGQGYAEVGDGPGRTPDFAMISVTKGGTSALAAHLAEHPVVHVVSVKELYYFDRFLRDRDRTHPEV